MKLLSPADCASKVKEYIRCATPFNFWSYILLLGFGIAAFFSPVVRAVAKNFPMVIIKSHRSGKSQGKSTAAESVLWATSNPDSNRLQNYVKTEQINKLVSQVLPVF